MKLKLAVIAISIFALVGCNNSNSDQPLELNKNDSKGIFGGQRVSASDPAAKSTVAIFNEASGGLCTGTLIASDIVLTAGHCVTSRAADFKVIFETTLNHRSIYLRVSQIARHPKYTDNPNVKNMYDMALIKLASPMPTGFQSVAVWTNDNEIKKGINVLAAGYGVSWVNVIQAGSGILRQVVLPVEDPKYSETEIKIGANFVKGICSGDSGGPTYLRKNDRLYLVGVTSRGSGIVKVSPCSGYTIVSKASAFIPWIQETLAQFRK